MSFPKHWTTDRVRVDSVCAAEGEALTALFNSSTDVIDMDPTFYVVDVPEVLGLIEESVKCEAAERGFRMQAARLKASNELLGYFHFYEGQPRPEVVGMSMFFIRPEVRSGGYGREVADGLMKQLASDPVNRVVWARVYLKNIPALRFWMRQGFTRIVEHKGRHIDVEGTHSSIILERALR